MGDTFEKVGKYTTLPEAHIAIGRLEAEGIPAFIPNAHLAQVLPGVLGPVPVLVAAEHADEARRILAIDYSGDLDDDHEAS